MFCNKCGKEIANDSQFCYYCGATIRTANPRHARPEPEEIYSHSENSRPDDAGFEELNDTAAAYSAVSENAGRTRVYNFEMFEDHAPARRDRYQEAFEEPGEDPRAMIDDSYDDYQDGEDDLTFMDKLDNKFRRNDDGRSQGGMNWLWIVIGAVAALIVIVILVLLISGALSGDAGKPDAANGSTSATIYSAAPLPTQSAYTYEPATQTDETQAPDATEAVQATEYTDDGSGDDSQSDDGDDYGYDDGNFYGDDDDYDDGSDDYGDYGDYGDNEDPDDEYYE